MRSSREKVRINLIDIFRWTLRNIQSNGVIALIYPYGLSGARYIEYTAVINYLGNGNGKILDLGCGHSLLPGLLIQHGAEAVVVDISEGCLTWQKEKVRPKIIEALKANALSLPFSSGTFSSAVSVSVIEHIEDDVLAIKELVRVLKDGGMLVISIPISPDGGFTSDPLFGVPPWQQKYLGSNFIRRIMKKANVDRGHTYFERFYSRQQIINSIIGPSECLLESCTIYWDWRGLDLVDHFLPKGVFTPLQITASYFSPKKPSKSAQIGGIILKLRKNFHANFLEQAEQNLPEY